MLRLHGNRAMVDGEKITKALKFEFWREWRGVRKIFRNRESNPILSQKLKRRVSRLSKANRANARQRWHKNIGENLDSDLSVLELSLR